MKSTTASGVRNDSSTAASDKEVLHRVFSALETDAQLDMRRHPITLTFAEGVLSMDGELANVAAKTRALRRAAAVPHVRWVVDRLRVEPGAHVEDGAIRDHVRDALLGDSAFQECRLVVQDGDSARTVFDPSGARGTIFVTVRDGIVTLDGNVPSLSHRRLAGALAWWNPGTRNVENRLGVTPPEEDNDGEISDAVRLVLEKDPLVNAGQLRVRTNRACVTLSGVVHTDAERDIAARDAWYVLGVDDVINAIEIYA